MDGIRANFKKDARVRIWLDMEALIVHLHVRAPGVLIGGLRILILLNPSLRRSDEALHFGGLARAYLGGPTDHRDERNGQCGGRGSKDSTRQTRKAGEHEDRLAQERDRKAGGNQRVSWVRRCDNRLVLRQQGITCMQDGVPGKPRGRGHDACQRQPAQPGGCQRSSLRWHALLTPADARPLRVDCYFGSAQRMAQGLARPAT